METINETPFVQQNIAAELNLVLADEYIIMNKTAQWLSNTSTQTTTLLQAAVYDELKQNVNAITEFLKSNSFPLHLSISFFLANTRLQVHSNYVDEQTLLRSIIADHVFVLNKLGDCLVDFSDHAECTNLFEPIAARHQVAYNQLQQYRQQAQGKFFQL